MKRLQDELGLGMCCHFINLYGLTKDVSSVGCNCTGGNVFFYEMEKTNAIAISIFHFCIFLRGYQVIKE
ncbi:hypothetical protein BLGI_730 [Brevibacillus laterosporus GI-9]|nr:hypothetical protein BLGI_730 [Brevibacillus laterosporus GI-9]